MTVKTYDPASYELAEHFLQDEPCRDDPELYKKHCHSLALEIQQAVEDWFFVPEVAWMGAPHTQPDIVSPADHSVSVPIEALYLCGCPVRNMSVGECAETQCGCSIRAERLKGCMSEAHQRSSTATGGAGK